MINNIQLDSVLKIQNQLKNKNMKNENWIERI